MKLRVPWSLLGPVLLTAALVLAVALLPPRAGEPMSLRWLRVAASHPWRTGLGLLLLAFALEPSRSLRIVRDLPKRPAAARGQGRSELR